MPTAKRSRTSTSDIRSRTEALHRAACATGDDFLQYLFGMALLYLDTGRINRGQPVEQPAASDPQVAMAAKMLTSKRQGG